MPADDKKLEKLNKLFEMINEDYATPDDLIKVSEAFLGILTAEKERINNVIANEKEEDKKERIEILRTLEEKERGLKSVINRLTYETEQSVAEIDNRLTKTLSNEVKRLEKKIPARTDLTGIYSEIEEIKKDLVQVPTEITANPEAVRDALELLQGDERLDRSAIKGLDELLEAISKREAPNSIGVKLLRYLQDVDIQGITNGETLIWNSSRQRFEAGSAGSGSGHTIQDEGTPLTTRANLNFVGAGVTVTDDAGNDATVVTIAGGSGADLQGVTDIGNTTDNDIEITDTTKGVIIKSANGTRWRIGITNNGELTAVSL